MTYHNPVLLSCSIEYLLSDLSGNYVDATFGGGGHARKIMENLTDNGKLIAFDQDKESQKNIIDDTRFHFVPYNFKHLKKFVQYYNGYPADGILADLGVSSHQFDTAERGFSHRLDGQLDMRMNNEKGISARDVINSYDEKKLAEIFYVLGELPNGKRIADRIVKTRCQSVINTTKELSETVTPLLQKGKENKQLSQLFQAIRIEVNDEMNALKEFLAQTTETLKPGGRLVIISYHSLEDRLVKNFMRSGNFTGVVEKDFYGNALTPFTVITRKAIIPTEEEINENPRSRSAKLRVAERKA